MRVSPYRPPISLRHLFAAGALCLFSGVLSPLPLRAVDPSAAEDAAIERQKILKAADQIELVTQQNEQIRVQVQELRTELEKLRAENTELRKNLASLDKARAGDRETLLKEVSEIVASGKTNVPSIPPARITPPAAPATGDGFEHVVLPGQSLWAIAKAFQDQGIKVSVEDIRTANHLKSNNLQSGQKLFIPKK